MSSTPASSACGTASEGVDSSNPVTACVISVITSNSPDTGRSWGPQRNRHSSRNGRSRVNKAVSSCHAFDQ